MTRATRMPAGRVPAGAGMSGGALAALVSKVNGMMTRTASESHGIGSLPANISIGATFTVRVTLRNSMGSTNYTPTAFLAGNGDLSTLRVHSTTVIDAQTVDVVIKSGLVSLTLSAAAIVVLADAN